MNTQKGIAPVTTAGAGALPPAPEVLTIDRGGEWSLRNLWLLAEQRERRAVDYMEKLMRRAWGKRGETELTDAFCAMHREWRETVQTIREKGGLLHIGGAF